ncbi:MAG: DUF2161 domain-containing phosphodiesterase [Hyphomicrobiaceae bacterium]
MRKGRLRETELYEPVKTFLEGQGYEVKAEVGAADVVACNGEDPPVIVELKTGFSLSLFHQAVARQSVTDAVYIAVPLVSGKAFRLALKSNKSLCRRLGLGLLTIRLRDGLVTPHIDPKPYSPRKSATRSARLLREFAKRVGDPNTGGATRRGLITAYRQDALRCLSVLQANGPTKASEVARLSGVATARRIMADDHYGWFERVSTGIYALSPKGNDAQDLYRSELKNLAIVSDAA